MAANLPTAYEHKISHPSLGGEIVSYTNSEENPYADYLKTFEGEEESNKAVYTCTPLYKG